MVHVILRAGELRDYRELRPGNYGGEGVAVEGIWGGGGGAVMYINGSMA